MSRWEIYAQGIGGEGTQLVDETVSQEDGPVLVSNTENRGVHPDGNTFLQAGRTDITERVRSTERSGLDHGPGDLSLLDTIHFANLKEKVSNHFGSRIDSIIIQSMNLQFFSPASGGGHLGDGLDQAVGEGSDLVAGLEPGGSGELLPPSLGSVRHEQDGQSSHADFGAFGNIAGQAGQDRVDL